MSEAYLGLAASDTLSDDLLDAVTRIAGVQPQRRSDLDLAAAGTRLDVAAASVPELTRRVREVTDPAGVAAAVTTGQLASGGPALLISDVDSTVITGEVIDLLAEHAGTGEQVAAITERAMRGELDFAESLAERVATLAGLPVAALHDVAQAVELSPGAIELAQSVQANGGQMALVSGGFTEIVEQIAVRLSVHLFAANRLEEVDGRLTGHTVGEVVDRAAKARWLAEFRRRVGAGSVVAVGDGANDLDLLAAADLGVAYCAKPVTAEAADAAIPFPRLDAVAAFWPGP